MTTTAAVIPSWNRRALLERLLADLRRQSCPPGEIIVVDNGSTDGSIEAAEGAGARVIRMGFNAGFAHAVNAGIRAADAEWVAVLNNDVELDPCWLEALLTAAARPEVWFATGKTLSAGDRQRIDGAWDLLARSACAWRAGHGLPDGAPFTEPRGIRSAPWTAALFRSALFARIGLLDERFESYLEDVEFGLRAALEDCRGVYVPDALAWHHGSATLGRWHPDTVRRMARNQVFVAARHYPPPLLWRYGWALVVGQCLWGALAARHGAGLAWTRGKLEGLRRFREVRPAGFPAGHAARVAGVLAENERELAALQRSTGFESYWRLYLAATAGGAI